MFTPTSLVRTPAIIFNWMNGTYRLPRVGIMNETLYAQTFTGTKELIEEYVDEVCFCIRALQTHASSELPEHLEGIRSFLQRTSTTWGTTALCLSGGAMNGMHHFGVVKTLLKHGLMPQVGLSRGGSRVQTYRRSCAAHRRGHL